MAPARDGLSAAEWEDLQSEPDEETFLARAKEVFGVDLYNAPSLNARRRARQEVTAPGYGTCAG
jgi:hypothetical protein